jgi:predicted transcriptional regulator YdeE
MRRLFEMSQVVEKAFKVVGERRNGLFKDYAQLVPKAAQQFLSRVNEIPQNTGVEVTVYEPPREREQLEGSFIVGVLVDEKVEQLPSGMEFIEVQEQYAMTKGKVSEIGEIYESLDKWIVEQGYQHESPEHYIIEVYCVVDDAEEEVEVYIPIKLVIS